MELCGRTENYRVVNFEGQPEMIGTFVDVLIKDVHINSLRGELIRTEADMEKAIPVPVPDKFKRADFAVSPAVNVTQSHGVQSFRP